MTPGFSGRQRHRRPAQIAEYRRGAARLTESPVIRLTEGRADPGDGDARGDDQG